MQRKRLHLRQIRIEAFDIGDDRMLLVGGLDDTRFEMDGTPKVHDDGRDDGVIHDMGLEMEVNLRDFTIVSVRVQMPQVPIDPCRDIMPSFQSLVGLRIAGGFTSEVKRRLGGTRGCAHLVSLVLAIAPVVVQGAGERAARYGEEKAVEEVVRSYNVNSCHIWAENGLAAAAFPAAKQPA